MPKYGKRSKRILATCDPKLQVIFNEVIKIFDNSITEGTRGKKLQNKYFDEKLSKVKFPNSKHNVTPSKAVHAVPYPIDWGDTDRFYYFAGWVMAIARRMKIPLRWGGDWDNDLELKDNNFDDLAHYELI